MPSTGPVSAITDKNVEMGVALLDHDPGGKLESAKRNALGAFLQGLASKSVLADVGCFDGRFYEIYRNAGIGKVDGFDVNQVALERAQARGMNVKRWEFNSEAAPAPDDFYDAIVCTDVIEHVFDTANLLHECRRILKPKGYGAFVTPNLASWRNRVEVALGRMPYDHPGVSIDVKTDSRVNLGHIRTGTAREWMGLFRSSGFSIERISGLWQSGVVKALGLARPTMADGLLFICAKSGNS
jgi:SAM-dependent methyltransferase